MSIVKVEIGDKNCTFALGDYVTIKCGGDILTNVWLLSDNFHLGTVVLKEEESFATPWHPIRHVHGDLAFRYKDADLFLDGDTTEGSVRVSNQMTFPYTGTRWEL